MAHCKKVQENKDTGASSSTQNTQSFMSQSQIAPVLTSVEKNSLAKQLTTYLLLISRSFTPIKRANIVKYILKDYSKEYLSLMNAVSRTLINVYNYKVVYIDEQKKDKIVLYACVKTDPIMHAEILEKDRSIKVLLLLVLSIIDRSNNKVLIGADILRFLVMCGIIDEANYKHDELGDIRKMLFEEFVRCGYLSVHKKLLQIDETSTTNTNWEYVWGPRAHLECSPQFVDAFVSKIFSQPSEDE